MRKKSGVKLWRTLWYVEEEWNEIMTDPVACERGVLIRSYGMWKMSVNVNSIKSN